MATPDSPLLPTHDTATPDTGRGWLTRPWVRVLGLYLAALCVSAPIVTLQVRAHHGLFVLDEIMYVDYLYRVHEGTIALPHGQKLGASAIEQRQCRGVEIIGSSRDPIPHSCSGGPVDTALLPNGGYNSADIYPPTYFVLTDAAARVIMATGLTDDLVTAGRLTGALWMAGALVVAYLLDRELGAGKRASTLAMAVTGSASWLLVFWYHLTPDAASVFLGGLVFLLALRWERRAVHWGWLVGVAALLVLVKPANVLATTMACLFLLIRAVWARRSLEQQTPAVADLPLSTSFELGAAPARDAYRRGVHGIGALLGGTLGALAVWFGVRTFLYPAGGKTPYDNRFRAHGFSVHWIVDNVATFLTIPNMGQHNVGNPELYTLVLVFGSVAALALLLPGRARLHSAAMSVLAVTVTGAWLIVVLLLVTQDVYVRAEPRYGLSLVAAAIAVAATLWRTRTAQVVVALLALALLVNSLGLTGHLAG